MYWYVIFNVIFCVVCTMLFFVDLILFEIQCGAPKIVFSWFTIPISLELAAVITMLRWGSSVMSAILCDIS